MNAVPNSRQDDLVDSLKAVITHAEELLRAAQDDSLDKGQEMRAQIQERIRQAKLDLVRLQDSALGRVKEACHTTDTYVHNHPWRSAGVAAATGLVVGLLLSRR